MSPTRTALVTEGNRTTDRCAREQCRSSYRRSIGAGSDLFGEIACFHCQMLFECFTALPIDSRCFLLPRHLASGREQIQRSVDLVNQRVPSASFHLIIFKCRQHSIGPDNRLSPPANVGCLPGWCSRKRHSVRQSVFRLTFHESELYESTFLPATGGFQPPKGAFARGGFGSRRSTLL